MPTQGNVTTEEAQDLFTSLLQSTATTDGLGAAADVTGLAGVKSLEVNNSTAGTTTLTIEGSFDGVTWYACGYQQIDNTASPTRAVAPIAVAATPFAHVYQVLDVYSRIRARMSSSSSSPAPSVTATLRALPLV